MTKQPASYEQSPHTSVLSWQIKKDGKFTLQN